MYVKLVPQKRNNQTIAYNLLVSDQMRVTLKTAVYIKSFTSDLNLETVPMHIEQIRSALNYKTVVVA
jgi:hypothetical protein